MGKINQLTIKSPEESILNFWNKISRNDKIAFASGFLFCLIVHFFAYTNTLFVHDSIQLLNESDGLQNGRFFINLLMPLVSRITIPWVIGIITSIFLGLCNLFLTKTINISKPLYIIITGSLLASFPVMAANHIYFSSVYIYVFAMLTATLCVYFSDKNVILSGICLIISLSSYQAYLCFAVTLFLVKMLVDMMEEKIKGKQVILKGLKYISIIIASTIIYYVLWKGIMFIFDVDVIKYRGYNTFEQTLFENLLSKLFTTIICSLTISCGQTFTLSLPFKIIYTLINILSLVFAFLNIPKKTKNRKFAILIFLLFPIAISLIFLINSDTMHLLMMPAAVLPVVLFIKNIENLKFSSSSFKNGVKWIALISLISIVLNFSVTTNITYLKAKTQFDNSISYCTRVLGRLEQTEGFNKDTKVIIVNTGNTYGIYNAENWSLYKVFPMHSHANGAITYPETFRLFLTQELNTNIDITVDKNNEYGKLKEVKELEPFPSNNCTTWVGDVLVFKMG